MNIAKYIGLGGTALTLMMAPTFVHAQDAASAGASQSSGATDTNGDGKPDAYDTTGDGKPDTKDANGDGKPD